MAPVDQLFDMVGMFHLVHKQIVYVAPFLKNLHAFHAGHAVHVIQFCIQIRFNKKTICVSIFLLKIGNYKYVAFIRQVSTRILWLICRDNKGVSPV